MKATSSRVTASRKLDGELEKLEGFFVKNSTWLAMGIIAAAFAMRVAYSASCYLNPDEALHFDTAWSRSWLGAYETSHALAHPPLFILVLHGFLFLGHSEVVLRLPSVIAGTAALWFTFAWIRRSVGEVPALAGLVFMAVSPAAISASTEVRQYGLLLFFVCGSLYATECAIADGSVHWALVQGLLLLAAILTHYIAVIVICCIDLYVVFRYISDRYSRQVLWALGAGQVVVASVFAWLYFAHIRKSAVFDPASLSYLHRFFYIKGEETLPGFVWRGLIGTFTYLVSHRFAVPSILAILAGVALLISGRSKAARSMWVLIVSPFAIGLAAAIAHVFPFAGSRHQAYLLPFSAMGLAAMFTWMPQRLVPPILLLSLAIAPVWVARNPPDNNPRLFPVGDMTAAIDYINRTIPRGAPIFVDGQSGHILTYYLARDGFGYGTSGADSDEYRRPGGHRIIAPHPFIAIFDPGEAIANVNESAAQAGVPSGTPLWIVTVAWPYWVPLSARLQAGSFRSSQTFGTISVIETVRN